MNLMQIINDQSNIEEAQMSGQEIRYKIIMNTQVAGGSFAWI